MATQTKLETIARDLFDKYLAAKTAKDACEMTLQRVKEQAVTPGTQYTSFDDYEADKAAVEQYQKALALAEGEVKAARAEKESIDKQLRELLPLGIWFRHGALGFGIAWTDWGGSRAYVHTAPWTEKMPSLDHCHRGD